MQIDYLTFTVGKEYFAFNVKYIHEILIHHYYTRVNETDTFIAGIVNFKGNKFPVINTRKKLNINTKCRNNCSNIIIFKYDYRQEHIEIAANVNSIEEIVQITSPDTNQTISEQKYSCIKGTFNHYNQLVYIIDPDQFLFIPDIKSSPVFNKTSSIA